MEKVYRTDLTWIVYCLATILLMAFVAVFPSPVLAEVTTHTATGEYLMGDNDTYTEAKNLALQDAKRNILEKIGTYIESTTKVKDYTVKSDEIRLYTAGIVKVDILKEERQLVENRAMVLKVTVKALVDPDNVMKQINAIRNKKEVEAKSRKLAADNERLRKEIDHLNSQLRSSVNEAKYRDLRKQREVILDKIVENEKGLTILLSEGSLLQAALFDRKKKQDNRKTVKRFLKEVAAAYIISHEDPQIEDNENGTGNVKIPVSLKLPGTFSSKGSIVKVESMNDMSAMGFLIHGYSDGGMSFTCSKTNTKQCESLLKPYLDNESNRFRIEAKLGRYSSTEALTVASVLGQKPTRNVRTENRPQPIYESGSAMPHRMPGSPPPTYTPFAAHKRSRPSSSPSYAVYVAPLCHEKYIEFNFNHIPLSVLKTITKIEIKVLY